MFFTSFPFLIFFAAVLLAQGGLRLPPLRRALSESALRNARNALLLASGYVFYGWWDWRFCFLLLATTLVAYFAALQIRAGKGRRAAVAIGVIVPLAVLAFFKYTNFFLDSFGALLGIENLGALTILLPLGISFYIFQSIGYTVDVYRGKIEPEKNFISFALFSAFFPVLISGPIMKAQTFLPQLKENRQVTASNLAQGAQIFLFGFAKKMVLADHMSLFVDQVYAAPLAFSSGTVFLAMISYSLQLYFDFSGYSDMAIGCAKCLGFDLPRNFNMPYISKNVSEFWKRWHISLSSWLMEYLYIPLGGNRKGRARTYVNLMLTMLLGGLWHGASWNFVIWGALHGGALCVHKLYLSLRGVDPKASRADHPAASIFKMAVTFLVVTVAWVFFRAETWTLAITILTRAFSFQSGVSQMFLWSFVSAAAMLLCTGIALWRGRSGLPHPSRDGFYPRLRLDRFLPLVLFFFAIGLLLGLAYTGSNPFIYAQF